MLDIRNDDKTVVLIDGANMYATTKALGFDIDFSKFYNELDQSCNLLRIYYYTALVEEEGRILLKPLVDWLTYNNYTMVMKPAKVITNSDGVRKIKGNMDVELAVDAIDMVASMPGYIGNMVLCTGDGDFVSLIKVLQRRGVKVTVISSIATSPPMCADDLRKQADSFADLQSLRILIEKPFRKYDQNLPVETEAVNVPD